MNRLVAIILLLAGQAVAQVGVSGTLAATYKQDFGRDEGEGQAAVNKTLKGASPFSQIRGRFFIDSEVSENIGVFTTLLFDEQVAHFDLEGAYIVVYELGGLRSVNALVGKMATPFGTFASRSFATANPLIGMPLIYHYFSAVRGASVLRDNADQLSRRDAPNYSERGQPTLYDACWNTGLQLFGSFGPVTYALAMTEGAVSNPTATDNDGLQYVGRLGLQPTIALKFGVSGAYAPYLNKSVERNSAFPAGRSAEDYKQRLIGLDAEYSAGHFQLISEWVFNQWQVPNLAEGHLSHSGGYIEGKYELGPGVYYALRYGRIDYGDIDDGQGGQAAWDYGIQRIETGFGYYLDRRTRLKALVQLNSWAGALDESDHLVSLQLASDF
ncbi:hypothetical protein OAF45_02565 [Candidatus Latescibacteria bacterium]|nr:hypothetical protein [Candidatus Latescibacterota bacterium]